MKNSFMRWFISRSFMAVITVAVLYHTTISFEGSKVFKPMKPLWEAVCDKGIQVVKAIF